jgi:hypothetical protein
LSTSRALLFHLLLGCAPALSAADTIEQAVELVASKAVPVYRGTTSPECLSFMAEGEIRQDFDIAIRERHSGKCGGDPQTSPIVDRFRVRRGTGTVLWYDVASGEYVPFDRFVRSRSR